MYGALRAECCLPSAAVEKRRLIAAAVGCSLLQGMITGVNLGSVENALFVDACWLLLDRIGSGSRPLSQSFWGDWLSGQFCINLTKGEQPLARTSRRNQSSIDHFSFNGPKISRHSCEPDFSHAWPCVRPWRSWLH